MTYCVAIKKKLSTSICPLKEGRCMWQHRVNNKCCYTNKDLTISEYCTLTAQCEPSEDEIKYCVQKIIGKIRE